MQCREETTHRVWLQGCWKVTSLHWFLMSGLAFSNGEDIVTAIYTWYSVLLLLGLLCCSCSSLSVYSDSGVNSWGHKRGPLEGSKTPTLNTRICFSKQEHLAFWLPYWLFFRQLWAVCGEGLGLRVSQAVRWLGGYVLGNAISLFILINLQDVLFLGHSPSLNFSWELWSRSPLNDKGWFTVRD